MGRVNGIGVVQLQSLLLSLGMHSWAVLCPFFSPPPPPLYFLCYLSFLIYVDNYYIVKHTVYSS